MNRERERVRILIVDDDPIVRTAIGSYLAQAPDLEIVGEAANGTDAIRMAKANVDIVMMDVRMPGMDGLEASRRIRSARTPAPRILLLTSFDEEALAREAIMAQASGLLQKRQLPSPSSRQCVRFTMAQRSSRTSRSLGWCAAKPSRRRHLLI